MQERVLWGLVDKQFKLEGPKSQRTKISPKRQIYTQTENYDYLFNGARSILRQKISTDHL
jgi:hypothetical protein